MKLGRLERYSTIPSAHLELKRAAMNICADTGILSDEQNWLTLNLKQLLLLSLILYSSKSKSHQTILRSWKPTTKLSIKDYTSNAQRTALHTEWQNRNHESNYSSKTVLLDSLVTASLSHKAPSQPLQKPNNPTWNITWNLKVSSSPSRLYHYHKKMFSNNSSLLQQFFAHLHEINSISFPWGRFPGFISPKLWGCSDSVASLENKTHPHVQVAKENIIFNGQSLFWWG